MHGWTAAALLTIVCTSALSAEDWPGFLGPRRDGTSRESELPATFPPGGPRILWRVAAGEGYSGPVAVGSRILLFHQPAGEEVVQCLDRSSGRSLWSTGYPSDFQGGYGTGPGPRATPIVAGERIFTLGGGGVLECLDLVSGKPLWRRELRGEYAIPESFFGVGSTPLLDEGRLFVNVGAKGAGMAAFDPATGKTLWTATDDEASYSSPVAAQVGDQRMILFFSRSGLFGFNPKDGRQLFFLRWRSRSHASVNAATPLVVGDRVFVSSSYGTGALLARLTPSGAQRIWSSDEVLSCHYDTPVHRGGYLFGIDGRQDLGAARLVCCSLESGKLAWSKDDFGCATLFLVGDRILAARERGDLVWFEATPAAYRELARAAVVEGLCRPAPALSDGQLLLRTERELLAVDLNRPLK